MIPEYEYRYSAKEIVHAAICSATVFAGTWAITTMIYGAAWLTVPLRIRPMLLGPYIGSTIGFGCCVVLYTAFEFAKQFIRLSMLQRKE